MAFREASIDGVLVRELRFFHDSRGWLAELFRADQLHSDFGPAAADLLPQMAYISQTLPGVTRGPHEHRDQTDYFAFLGPGDFRVVLWDTRANSPTRDCRMALVVGASRPASLVVPPGVVHAYRNISPTPGWVFNAPNRLYAGWNRAEPVDEIRHEERPDSPFQFDK